MALADAVPAQQVGQISQSCAVNRVWIKRPRRLWDKALGTLEQGKRPDLLVLDGTTGDPYQQLLSADERDVSLVMIDGVARYGHRSLVTMVGGQRLETLRVGGRERV